MKNLVFVDCEGGGTPAAGLPDHVGFSEFGAVIFHTKETFHGKLFQHGPAQRKEVFQAFADWLKEHIDRHPIFVSDNPAYDWQFINHGFHLYLGYNPFGHSARRIGDFYAGLKRNFRRTQDWKRFRKTVHDHNPVNDAMGNVEAFERILSLMDDLEVKGE